MNQLNLEFLQQPINGQSFTFSLLFVPPLTQVYSATFVTSTPASGEIQIGITLYQTIENTRNYLQLNFPLPGLNYEIIGDNLVITKATRDFTLTSSTGIASYLVIGTVLPIIPKIKINIRSPYKILVDESVQDGSKIELFLWNKGTTKPTIPQYTLSKRKVSDAKTDNEYNISEFAKEYIKPIAPVKVLVPTEEDNNAWCYLDVKRYVLVGTTYTLIDTLSYICLNGFNSFFDGLNKSTIANVIPLVNTDIDLTTFNGFNYINCFISVDDDFGWSGNNDTTFTNTGDTLWKLPYDYNPYTLKYDGGADIFSINTEQLCEPKYTPLTVSFINRYGGWQFLTMFKKSVNSYENKSSNYNLLPAQSDYDIRQGMQKNFNFQLNQKVKCNTGFVPENYIEILKDLMVSDVILLDNKPVTLATSSIEEKTGLNDKMINYELEFKYNYNLMNDVI